MGTSEIFLLLSPPIMAAGLAKYRSDYRRHGRTTTLGVITTGTYAGTRNPQCRAFLPFVLGYAIVLHTPMAYVGVGLYLVLVHLTVLVEEEHLQRAFGDEYRQYALRTPRYLLR